MLANKRRFNPTSTQRAFFPSPWAAGVWKTGGFFRQATTVPGQPYTTSQRCPTSPWSISFRFATDWVDLWIDLESFFDCVPTLRGRIHFLKHRVCHRKTGFFRQATGTSKLPSRHVVWLAGDPTQAQEHPPLLFEMVSWGCQANSASTFQVVGSIFPFAAVLVQQHEQHALEQAIGTHPHCFRASVATGLAFCGQSFHYLAFSSKSKATFEIKGLTVSCRTSRRWFPIFTRFHVQSVFLHIHLHAVSGTYFCFHVHTFHIHSLCSNPFGQTDAFSNWSRRAVVGAVVVEASGGAVPGKGLRKVQRTPMIILVTYVRSQRVVIDLNTSFDSKATIQFIWKLCGYLGHPSGFEHIAETEIWKLMLRCL